jgi:hypothetical protein
MLLRWLKEQSFQSMLMPEFINQTTDLEEAQFQALFRQSGSSVLPPEPYSFDTSTISVVDKSEKRSDSAHDQVSVK